MLILLMLLPSVCLSGETLKKVRSKGVLRCGVSEGLPGFSIKDAKGRWTGMDADFCRAVAAAVFGDPEKVDFVALAPSERFPALRSGGIDLLSRNTTWTIGREAGLGVRFVGALFYDGQGFMVRQAKKLPAISGLKGATICVEKGTTSQDNLADHFRARNLKISPLSLIHWKRQKKHLLAESVRLTHLTGHSLQRYDQNCREDQKRTQYSPVKFPRNLWGQRSGNRMKHGSPW